MARRPRRPVGHLGAAQRALKEAQRLVLFGKPMKGTAMDRRQFCAGLVAGALPLASARAQA